MTAKSNIVMIGTFDGLHLAHQKMLKKTLHLALRQNKQTLALTFSFPPRLHFNNQTEPALLSTVQEKKWLFKNFGIQKVRILKFNNRLARLSAEHFFKHYLLDQLAASAVVVGYNFKFGKNKEGTLPVLKSLGKKYGVKIYVLPNVKDKERETISSGRIRICLKENKLDAANALLGHAYMVQGKVVPGQKIGKSLGFATANLEVSDNKILPRGVFVVEALINAKRLQGICNIGVRPTVDKQKKVVVEAHFFNFDAPLYGKTVTLFLLMHLRAEKHFASLHALKHQIQKDKIKALEFFDLKNRKIK